MLPLLQPWDSLILAFLGKIACLKLTILFSYDSISVCDEDLEKLWF